MPRKPSPSLIAFKAINLARDLTASEKRVAAVLIDSFNFQTGQCDPGLNTLARLLQISRRTIIRAIGGLTKKAYFRKVRHGGYFHRNSYEPIWSRFELDEATWSAHRKASRYRKAARIVTPSMRSVCHSDSDAACTQTYPINNLPETSSGDGRANRDSDTCGENSERAKQSSSKESPATHDSNFRHAHIRFSGKCVLDVPTRELIARGIARFEKRVDQNEIKAWFGNVEVEAIAEGRLLFSAPSAFIRSRIESDYVAKMERSICSKDHGFALIKITVRQ